ncbi:DNA protecting protein DprA [Candidatus Daviesbacteria bacterium RIFCSPLOWO2_01_FULL_39_12]|uniref:DNA protecting protein DprA n=1 Tax=Candidatus Daviesbacteria bacterium RIFCSPLOWO2_01_FULL_39_12 TaxID=1797785 RepID=A0A1F5KTU1_9BACT|nr:MAG: DNA protecting protein DprA [Candidatus Daviesbacteria bacterium RIFCSPLOWO2_01_FULL_39_12]
MNNIAYLLALHSINGLGPIRLKALLDYFKDPKLAWEASGGELKKAGVPQSVAELLMETRNSLDPQKYLDEIKKSGIKWMSIFDDDYPKLLKEIYDPPVIFYYKGEILKDDENAVGVVGTRKMTGYGRAVTKQLVEELVLAGLTIVSGLARGVDAQAHSTALENNGRTIAILGGGLNKIYPPENGQLAEKIIDGHGAVISEFPPDYPSLPGNFPSRNRIIAGLSKAVLVTEAAEDSGSLITAKLAVEQGREVFAVPGPITSSLSKGPIDLIKLGAKAIFDAQEILDEMGMGKVKSSKLKVKSVEELSKEERLVWECLENDTLHIDEIGRKLNVKAATISALLIKMEIKGIVQNLGNGNYCRK